MSIKSLDNNKSFLKDIYNSFEIFYNFYKFYFHATSAETLINRNNTFLLKDLKNIPYLENDSLFSDFDKNIIQDCLDFQQGFFINGESSKAISPMKGEKIIKSVITNYGIEFSRALNNIYGEDNGREFKLSDVVELDNSLIVTVFKFDAGNTKLNFHKDLSKLNIESLTDIVVSEQLSIKRIIKLYPQKDTIVFIKPNQYRYWLTLTAYRDADKCFSDFSNAGF